MDPQRIKDIEHVLFSDIPCAHARPVLTTIIMQGNARWRRFCLLRGGTERTVAIYGDSKWASWYIEECCNVRPRRGDSERKGLV